MNKDLTVVYQPVLIRTIAIYAKIVQRAHVILSACLIKLPFERQMYST
jgi:hypothetical protein